MAPTTPEELQRRITGQLTYADTRFAPISLSSESNIAGLIECVKRHGKNRKDIKFWDIEWCGASGSQLENTSEFVDLLRAIGEYTHSFNRLRLYLPFKPGDMAIVSKSLAFLRRKHVNCLLITPVNPPAFQEVVEVLQEACRWRGLRELFLNAKLYPDPSFLEQLAPILPKLRLNRPQIGFWSKNPPNNDDNFRGPDFIQRLKSSLTTLQQDGLEHNYSLHNLIFCTWDYSLGEKMGGNFLGTANFATLCRLNELGRKDVVSLPKCLDKWLPVLSEYSQDLDAIYYYLHRNTWMFGTKKEGRKRHEEELEPKNPENQILPEQWMKRQTTESQENDRMTKRLKEEA